MHHARAMSAGLQTDLYQLTMAAGYWRAGLLGPATYELFVRRLPDSRSYLIAAGLEQALDYLEQLSFTAADRAWLRALPVFAEVPARFFDEFLAQLSFTGDVWAVPEGTAVFPNEPLLRVTAPQPEAQLAETTLISTVGFQTSVATKASRIVQAAAGRAVIEFGARRAHGTGAALAASRAAFIGGCEATSYVEAARQFGIPPSGTMAHAWVQTFPTEMDAFREFDRTFASAAVYLLDTYDTVDAARALVRSRLHVPMVRLDSGDLADLSRKVRAVLDEGGWRSTRIFVTSDLDEQRIEELLRAGAPIDGFGVGTSLTTVSDAPALSAVYKLVEVERDGHRVGVVKLSADKHTWPGPKQVWRQFEGDRMTRDIIAAEDEPAPAGARPLLQQVMANGRRVRAPEALSVARERCRSSIAALPADLLALRRTRDYPVQVSAELEARRATLADSHGAHIDSPA